MAQKRGWWVRGFVLGSALLVAPVGAWADKLTEIEQAFETQQKSLQQLQQEMNRLRQDRTAQQAETDRRMMEVEKQAAEAAASSLQTGYDPWPGKGFYLKSADGQFRLNIGGYVQTLAQVEASRNEEAIAAADVAAAIARHRPSTLKLHRVRLTFDGVLFKDFGFLIQPEFVGPTATGATAPSSTARIEVAWGTYTYAPWARIKVGQMRDIYSLENFQVPQDLYFAAQRSLVVKALSPDLQMGILVSGDLKQLIGLPFYYGVGIFNGCGRVDQCSGGVDNDGDKEFTGRFAFSPPTPFGNLTIGLNADYRSFRNVKGGANDLATAPVAGTAFHRFNPTGPLGDRFGGDGGGTSQNGFLINGDRVTGGGDLVFDLYPFLLMGEYHYATQERDALGAGGSNLDNLIMQGGYGSIGYWIFGNKRNGLLANGRYEHLRVDNNKGEWTAPSTATSERPLEVRAGTLGLTWYVNPSVFVRGNYVLTDVRPGRNFIGVSNNTHGELTHQGIAELIIKF